MLVVVVVVGPDGQECRESFAGIPGQAIVGGWCCTAG